MFASKEQIHAATALSIADVLAALNRTSRRVANGEITGVEFQGMTETGQFAYNVFGPSPEEGDDDCLLGTVYLKYARIPMSKEFVLVSEF